MKQITSQEEADVYAHAYHQSWWHVFAPYCELAGRDKE